MKKIINFFTYFQNKYNKLSLFHKNKDSKFDFFIFIHVC